MVYPKAYAPPVNVARTREKLNSISIVTISSNPSFTNISSEEDIYVNRGFSPSDRGQPPTVLSSTSIIL